jgi:hypothetical protein
MPLNSSILGGAVYVLVKTGIRSFETFQVLNPVLRAHARLKRG